jgi:hypothetical protein
MISFEKKGNDLYLGNEYYEGPEDKYEKLKIPITTLFKLMDSWEKLMKEEPNEIILTYENGNFKLSRSA